MELLRVFPPHMQPCLHMTSEPLLAYGTHAGGVCRGAYLSIDWADICLIIVIYRSDTPSLVWGGGVMQKIRHITCPTTCATRHVTLVPWSGQITYSVPSLTHQECLVCAGIASRWTTIYDRQ